MIKKAKHIWAWFRNWQLEPFSYQFRNTNEHSCANCGKEFSGNYCPYCSQKADLGRVTWNSVWQSVSEVWGMSNRSLTYSILQLLFRPGYFIRDYISGKRQVSFPPVKMLLIVALVITFVMQIFGIETRVVEFTEEKEADMIYRFLIWAERNKGWGIMAISSLLIMPTWILFRYAPGYSRHTLPEGFFIQIFMGILMIICLFVDSLQILNFYGDILILVFYFIAYYQLFGHGWWGTTWRMILCWASALFAGALIASIIKIIQDTGHDLVHKLGGLFLVLVLFVIFIVMPLLLSYYIGRRSEQKRNLSNHSEQTQINNEKESNNSHSDACVGTDDSSAEASGG